MGFLVKRSMLIPLARAGYGAALLCAPGPMIRVCTRQSASPRARRVAQVLGIRHLAQAAVTVWAPEPEVVAVGAVIDLLHAASMLGFAAAVGSLRRAELTDALIAATLAVAEPASMPPSSTAPYGSLRRSALPQPADETAPAGEGEARRQAERGDGGEDVAVAEAGGHRGEDDQRGAG
jgi:hypothetical protein